MLNKSELKQLVEALAPILNPRSPPYTLGSQLKIIETPYSLTPVGLVATVQANANRVGLFIGQTGTTNVVLSIRNQTGAFQGLVLNGTNPNLLFNINDHGVLPQLAIYIYNVTTSSFTVTVQELIWFPEE